MRIALRMALAAIALVLLAVTTGIGRLAPPGPASQPASDPSVVGQWAPPQVWPVQAMSSAVLPTGKVLVLYSTRRAMLWDPATGTTRSLPIPADVEMGCSGLAFLPDGRLLLNGGHGAPNGTHLWDGHRQSWVLDPWAETWSRVQDMQHGRYYPATVTLADGRALTVNGNGESGADPESSEIWDGTRWSYLPNESPPMEFYPRLHVLPDGSLVRAGQDPEAAFLDLRTGAWTPGPRSAAGRRWGGTSVLLPGLDRVLVFGGGNAGLSSEGSHDVPVLRDPATVIAGNVADSVIDGFDPGTRSAEVLDVRTRTYREVAPMLLPRRDHAAVQLADGNVLALGGSVGAEPVPGWVDYAFHPELYDVRTETWGVMAPAERTRGYHSTGVLLPDGRVLFAGGDFELARGTSTLPLDTTGEVYSPPYLFRGPRPVITSAPPAVRYGAGFTVRSTGAEVARAALVRYSSTTHSLNTDQRWVELPVTQEGDHLRLSAPTTGGVAPPGYYMLFLLSRDGVPSVSKPVRVS